MDESRKSFYAKMQALQQNLDGTLSGGFISIQPPNDNGPQYDVVHNVSCDNKGGSNAACDNINCKNTSNDPNTTKSSSGKPTIISCTNKSCIKIQPNKMENQAVYNNNIDNVL